MSRVLVLSAGISIVASAMMLIGCPVAEKETYPNGVPIGTSGGMAAGGNGGGMAAGGNGAGGNGGIGGAGCTCINDNNPCTKQECPDDGTCVLTNVAVGTDCDTNKQCDGSGSCLLVNGQPCMSEAGEPQCLSGACADGVCCDEACGGTCRACDLPGAVGTCNDVPDGTPDSNCSTGMACQGNTCKTGKALGDACAMNNECLSGECVAGTCRIAVGAKSFCKDPVQCASNYCTTGKKCDDAPQKATDCTSGEKANSVCLAAPGEPCGNGLGCMSKATCLGGICKAINGEACSDSYTCVSNFCKIPVAGMPGTCSDCTADADCGGVAGSCTTVCPNIKLPKGAYCTASIGCASNNCTGFPRTCQ